MALNEILDAIEVPPALPEAKIYRRPDAPQEEQVSRQALVRDLQRYESSRHVLAESVRFASELQPVANITARENVDNAERNLVTAFSRARTDHDTAYQDAFDRQWNDLNRSVVKKTPGGAPAPQKRGQSSKQPALPIQAPSPSMTHARQRLRTPDEPPRTPSPTPSSSSGATIKPSNSGVRRGRSSP